MPKEALRYPRVKSERPKSRSSKKLLFALFLLFMTLLVILFFRSSISKVDRIVIDGNRYAAKEQIGQALGMHPGDSFFKLGSGEMARRIEQAVPVVKKAEVAKRFPGKIEVRVTEYPYVALDIGPEGGDSLLFASGYAMPLAEAAPYLNLPVLNGWAGKDKLRARLCTELSRLSADQLRDVSEIQPSPTKSYADKLKIYTRSGFEVYTTIGYLRNKVDNMNAIIAKMPPGRITLLEADTYEPFPNNGNASSGNGSGGSGGSDGTADQPDGAAKSSP